MNFEKRLSMFVPDSTGNSNEGSRRKPDRDGGKRGKTREDVWGYGSHNQPEETNGIGERSEESPRDQSTDTTSFGSSFFTNNSPPTRLSVPLVLLPCLLFVTIALLQE